MSEDPDSWNYQAPVTPPTQVTPSGTIIVPPPPPSVTSGSQDPDSPNYNVPVTPPTQTPYAPPYIPPPPPPPPPPPTGGSPDPDSWNYGVPVAPPTQTTPGGTIITPPPPAPPTGGTGLEGGSPDAQNDYGGDTPTWVVTTPDGETVEFDEYMDAVDYVEDLQPPTQNTPPPIIDLNTNTPGFFIDAPGMEGYVSGLGIPTTQSGITTQGWIDAQISAVSTEIHQFGRDLEASAREDKLSGNNLAAGAQASAAVAVGVASALFDDATWLLNAYENTVPNVVEEFADNPLFATGYVGGNVALALYGGSQLYEGLKGKSLKGVKDWFDDPDRFIDVNPQQVSEAKGIKFGGEYDDRFKEVATEWPEGSPELAVKQQMGVDRTAYSMVDPDSDYVALMTPLDLDTPFIRYPTYVPPNPTIAAALAGLGVTGIANSLLIHNQQFIDSASPLTQPPTIEAVLRTAPQQIPVVIPGSDVKPVVIPDSTPIQEPISTPDTAVIQDPVSTPVQTTPTIQEPVIDQPVIETPITDTPVIPAIDVPAIPDEPAPPEEPGKLPRLKGESVLTKREEVRRRAAETKPMFTVRLHYGRKTVSRGVEARTFHEALAKVLKGSPSEVEVRRLR